MPPQNLPRAQNSPRARARRRRSSCPPFIFVFLLLWALMMVSFNIARVLMLPEIFTRDEPRETGPPKEPNYYERLGVDPLVSDATLKQLWRNFSLEMHPVSEEFQFPSACAPPLSFSIGGGNSARRLGFRKKYPPAIADHVIRLQDKRAHDPEVTAKFVVVRDMFDTFMDGMRRCEYDKKHRIKGKWGVQTCRDAFRKEYRELREEKKEEKRKLQEEQRAAALEEEKRKLASGGDRAGGDQGSSAAPEDEPAPRVKPTPIPPGRMWPPASASEPQRWPIPVGTEPARPAAGGAVAAVTSTAAQAWESFAEFWFWAQSIFVHRCRDVLSVVGVSS